MAKSVKIVSWNINSVRLRIGMVIDFLNNAKPDILCLQEIKCENHAFPHQSFYDAGYPYHYVSGQKSYNGVAIISKVELSHIDLNPVINDLDGARYIAGYLPNGIKLKNYYIPAGGDLPDETLNDKFKHKMNFVRSIRDSVKSGDPQIILGDFNIAPYEHDVWSHKQLLDVVSHTPQEVSLLNELRDAGDYCDIARHFHDEHKKLYSWWSYRARDWETSNRGRRLDHIWCSNSLKDNVVSFDIHKPYRNYEKPSDHVPISIEYAL